MCSAVSSFSTSPCHLMPHSSETSMCLNVATKWTSRQGMAALDITSYVAQSKLEVPKRIRDHSVVSLYNSRLVPSVHIW